MKKRRIFKFLVVLLFFIFLINLADLSKIHALSANLTWGEEIYYPSWLGNWSTQKCYINGSLAYCLESSKNTPSAGTYGNAVIDSNEALLKVLYYGYGGPGDVFKDDYVTNDTNKYLYTHIMASYAYSGDIYGGKSWNDLNKIGVALEGRYQQIQSMPVPTSDFFIDGSSNLTVNAYYENGLQRTKDMVFNSDSNVTINIPLEKGMELHNVSQGKVYTNTGRVSGGNVFYLTSDLSNKSDYSSGDLAGNNLMMYAPLVIRGNATYQSEGTLTKVFSSRVLKLNVNWISGSEIAISKEDDFGENIVNARFNLLQWNKLIGGYEQLSSLTYNEAEKIYESGFLERTDANEGKFKIEEIVPAGYTKASKYEQEFELDSYIDRNIFTVNMEGQEVTVKMASLLVDHHSIRYEAYNVPNSITAVKFPTWSSKNGQDDLRWVALTKELDGVWRADIQIPESEEYIIHGYYDTALQSNIACFATTICSSKPIVKVVNNRIMGKVTVTKADEMSGEKLPGAKFEIVAKNDIISPQGMLIFKAGDVAGNMVTNQDGYAELNDIHLGTYVLRETLPPIGYHIAANQEFTLTAQNNDVEIVTANLMVSDKVNNLKVKKIDKDTGSPLQNAKFVLYNVSENKEIGKFNSNENGEIDISKLAGGNTYYIQEVAPPAAYKLNDIKFYFEIDQLNNTSISNLNSSVEDGTFFVDQNGDMTITVKNEINLWNLCLTKKNDADKVLLGAQFVLYSDQECKNEVISGTTDNDGKLNFDNIVIGDYYLKETKAPDGYRLLKEPIKISLKNNNGQVSFYINDEEVKSNDKNNSLTLENGLYTGNLTVINQRGSLLPATGSTMTLIVVGAGGGLCLFGLMRKLITRGNNENEI